MDFFFFGEVKHPQMVFLVETKEAFPLKTLCFFAKHVKVVVHLGHEQYPVVPSHHTYGW